jgi:hypothetical protein
MDDFSLFPLTSLVVRFFCDVATLLPGAYKPDLLPSVEGQLHPRSRAPGMDGGIVLDILRFIAITKQIETYRKVTLHYFNIL